MRSPEELWENQPGDYFFISSKSRSGKWKDHKVRAGDWDQVDYLLDQYEDHNLYMCPHGFWGDTGKRDKEHAADPHLLYADLDEVDPRELVIKPTIAIQSSPGRFVGYWVTDGPVGESLNRRLSYHIGADPSGWDRTQVLRIPGTLNFKYDPPPRVKLLWANGPTYKLNVLDRMLPQLPQSLGIPTRDDDAALRVYKRYEKFLPRWARVELLEGNPKTGKRSEVMWKLQNALIEAGADTEDAFTILWSSAWNKFRDRRNGEQYLRRELEKNLARRISGANRGSDESKEEKPARWNPLPKPISQVERENIDWLVPGLFARKEMTIVEGDPGVGKSYLVQVIAGLICDGKPIPVFDPYHPPHGKVAYFDTENTASTVTKARLEENGVVNLDNYFQGEDSFSIDDEERWQEVVDRLSELQPELIVFDTINTYVGGTDTYRSSETQQAMGFFKFLATELNCSVVLLRHLTKGGKDKAIYRGQGSIAFTGAARVVASVSKFQTEDDDDNLRIMTCTKNNLGAYFPSFTYSIDSLPDRLGKTNRSRLSWGNRVDLTSDDVFSDKKKEAKGESEMSKAKALLNAELDQDTEICINVILRTAGTKSIAAATLRKAADLLELVRFEKRRGEAWWRRP